MPTYATLDDLLTRFRESELVNATDSTGAGTIDTGAIAAALLAADNEIDAAIGTRYALPLAVVPPLLLDLACDIARYKIYPIEAPPLVRERYVDATAKLNRISAGTLTLPIDGAAPETSSSADVAYVSDRRVFTRDSMRGY